MYPKIPRPLLIISILSGLLLAVSLLLVAYAPVETSMGLVQKVFYFHTASAWAGLLSFITAAVAGAVYLRRRDLRWDVASLSAVEIGMVLLLAAILSGSVWAHAAWNTWWTWDTRLTTVTIVEFLYAACLILRQGIDGAERRARFSAVYVLLSALSVPFTFLSIRFYRTIHPVIIGSGDPSAMGAFSMEPGMLVTFLFCLLTFSVIFAALLWHRLRLGLFEQQLERQAQQLVAQRQTGPEG